LNPTPPEFHIRSNHPNDPKSIYTVKQAITPQDIEEHLNGSIIVGLTCFVSETEVIRGEIDIDDFQGVNDEVYDGNRIPGVPEHLFNLGLTWSHPSGFHAAWDLLYVGRFYADNANEVETDAYLVSNLRSGYRWASGDWIFEPFLGINNLFDEEYFGNIRLNASFGRYYEPAPERNIYAGLSLRYGF
jgi:outer membrane receptor protein involved in Fe transport